MDSGMINPTSTSPRAKSEGPVSSHPSPMEDTDAFSTRKRPRLDSGERTYRSMSADRLGSSPSDRGVQQSTTARQGSTVLNETLSQAPPLTPTKVTINVREPQATEPCSTASPESVQQAAMHDTNGTASSPPQADSPRVISVHSTPSGSPEIQVAEVEYISDDPAVTQWTALKGQLSNAKRMQKDLLHNFPGLLAGKPVRRMLHQVALACEKGDLAKEPWLNSLADWIESYLESTQYLQAYWWELLTEEREFWDELPSIADALQRRHESAKGTLQNVQRSDDGYEDSAQDVLDPLTKFLSAWTALALRMAEIDRQTLKDTPADAIALRDLVSDKYLLPLSPLLRQHEQMWKGLVNVSRYDNRKTISAMIARFVATPADGLRCLTDVASAILDRHSSLPALIPKNMCHFWLPGHILRVFRSLPQDKLANFQASLSSQVYEFFVTIEERLQTLIQKQVSGFSIVYCQNIISYLSDLLLNVAESKDELAQRVCHQKGIPWHSLPPAERAHLLMLSWKFETLKRCICEGRMEIRVQAVETMQIELVQAYHTYFENRPPPEHVIIRYLSDFLIQSKMIKYLVSPESHPQLIQRSPNILGFLVVTKHLSEADVDVVWNAIPTSHESRSNEAISAMLSQCFHLCTYSTLRYLVGKLDEVDIASFDHKMQEFARFLFDFLRSTWFRERKASQEKMDMPPFSLCLRLIRQSVSDGPDNIENGKRVRDWAILQLQRLLEFGPTPQAKENLFVECLDDIKDPKVSATGSIAAITALSSGPPEAQYIQHLCHDLKMTKALVDDYSRMVSTHKEAYHSPSASHEGLNIRHELLGFVIAKAPDSLSHELAEELWEVMVGSKAIDDSAREAAWAMLIDVVRASSVRNSFVDLCISHYLPALQSPYLLSGSLAFADALRLYITQTTGSRAPVEHFNASIVTELFWQLSVTVPPKRDNLEQRAINMLISLYLDSPDAHRRTREATDSVHIELVERCIVQLTAAASKLKAFSDGTSSEEDEPMVVVATDEEVYAQRLSFTRSLMILREFVQGVRSRPMYSPSPELSTKLPRDFEQLKGEPIKIRYQAFSGAKKPSNISTFEIGSLETVDELWEKLKTMTGFKKFRACAGGKELIRSDIGSKKMGEVDFPFSGLVLLQKSPSSEPDLYHASGLRPMELEVLRRFDDLYRLLSMEEMFARQVYDFLTAFPPHTSITNLVCRSDASVLDVFPTGLPFKVLYSAHALKLSLSHHLQHHSCSSSFVENGISKLATVLIGIQPNIGVKGCEIDLTVTGGLVDCLADYIRAARNPQCAHEEKLNSSEDHVNVITTALCLPRATALVEHCLVLLNESSKLSKSTEADHLICATLSVLLEASFISTEGLTALSNSRMVPPLISRLLLQDSRRLSRQIIVKTLKCACIPSSDRLTFPSKGLTITLYEAVVAVVSDASIYAKHSEQFFDMVLALLGSLDKTEQQSLDFSEHISTWTALLLQYEGRENLQPTEPDHFLYGLSRLLNRYFQLAKSLAKPIQTYSNLVEHLLNTLLFPDLYDTDHRPSLFSPTRENLYGIVLALTENDGNYRALLRSINNVVAQCDDTSEGWSWGIAQTTEDSTYEPNWSVERSKVVQSVVKYSGLRNLSNTCYMNSLLTQLFMNIKFRYFILNVNVTDTAVSQRLLHEIQTLFAFMQGSRLKAVDTQNVAESIVTYDNTAVDVTHQVDVDEFYNLLFDRLESQVVSAGDKACFRGFFGGQIVQQIKSKVCPHISERLEPFSAIQCDISGKSTLAESLNAYVQGEAMEGDNKYSCTSCGQYVDAVKRACLKDVPNNLIFHLKRFDYDLMHGTRTKINDRFEFPMEIDMAPYNVEYLRDTNLAPRPDIFALVGVLVHTGTAESGHYYSYIQERSSNPSDKQNWVEFNDMEVSAFDRAELDEQCFGGWHDPRYQKPNNAYMLFYERIESPLPTDEILEPALPEPLQAQSLMPDHLRDRISTHNQLFLRKFCLFDPAHIAFAKSMLKQLRAVLGATCSSDHTIEKEAIWLALEYLDKVLARCKDTNSFDEMLSTLTRILSSCTTCCGLALQWIIDHEYPLNDLLLRCPHPKVRRDFGSMLNFILQNLRNKAPLEYGFANSNDISMLPSDSQLPLRVPSSLFFGVAFRMRELWDAIHLYPRSWDDYFGLLAEMARLGPQETHTLLRLDFLRCCLQLLICDQISYRQMKIEQPYAGYIRMLEKHRKLPLTKLIELVANISEWIDFQPDAIYMNSPSERPFTMPRMLLTKGEQQYAYYRHSVPKPVCLFLEKILNSQFNLGAARRIVRAMVLAEPGAGLLIPIQNTIKAGINVEPAYLAAPYLEAALVCCECTPSAPSVSSLISNIAHEVQTIGQSGGREHLDFFQRARRIRSFRSKISTDLHQRIVVKNMPLWAPQLLMYWEEFVRQGTIDLMKVLLFDQNIEKMDDEEWADDLQRCGRDVGASCVKRCEQALDDGKPLGGVTEAIVRVVEVCLSQFYTFEEDERVMTDAEDVISRMRAMAVSDLDDQGSVEWANGSDEIPSDSDEEEYGTPP